MVASTHSPYAFILSPSRISPSAITYVAISSPALLVPHFTQLETRMPPCFNRGLQGRRLPWLTWLTCCAILEKEHPFLIQNTRCLWLPRADLLTILPGARRRLSVRCRCGCLLARNASCSLAWKR